MMRYRRPAGRGLLAVVFLTLVIPLGSNSSLAMTVQEQSCGDWVVATAPLVPGQPLPEDQVDLTATDGTFVNSASSTDPQTVIPTGLENRAVIRSLDGVYSVLDTSSGTATVLDFGEGQDQIYHNPFYALSSAGTQFALFGDAIGNSVFLVDLGSGRVSPIGDVIDSNLPVLFSMVSPDDEHLILQAGNDVYLTQLDTEAGVAHSAEQLDARFATFTSDGDKIVMIPSWSDDDAQILIRDLASGEERTISPPDRWFHVRVFSDDLILAARGTELVRLTLAGDPPVTIFDLGGQPIAMRYDPSSGNLLVREELDSSETWWIVPADGSAEPVEIPLLEDLPTVNRGLEGQWAFFPVGLAPGQGTEGNPYLSLDLSTGTLSTLLTEDSNDIYFFDQNPSDDGRFRLIQSVSTPQSRLWLLDSLAETATLVGQSPGNVVGALTPDGCYLAVGSFDALGEGRQGSVTILDIASGAMVSTIEDALLLGWAPMEGSAA